MALAGKSCSRPWRWCCRTGGRSWVGWRWRNATVRLTATNLAGGPGYTLEQSASLAGWTNALTFTATNDSQTLTLSATNSPAQFFRLRSP